MSAHSIHSMHGCERPSESTSERPGEVGNEHKNRLLPQQFAPRLIALFGGRDHAVATGGAPRFRWESQRRLTNNLTVCIVMHNECIDICEDGRVIDASGVVHERWPLIRRCAQIALGGVLVVATLAACSAFTPRRHLTGITRQ